MKHMKVYDDQSKGVINTVLHLVVPFPCTSIRYEVLSIVKQDTMETHVRREGRLIHTFRSLSTTRGHTFARQNASGTRKGNLETAKDYEKYVTWIKDSQYTIEPIVGKADQLSWEDTVTIMSPVENEERKAVMHNVPRQEAKGLIEIFSHMARDESYASSLRTEATRLYDRVEYDVVAAETAAALLDTYTHESLENPQTESKDK